MKTTNVPLIGKCPEWDGDVPPNRIAQFEALVGQVHQDILDCAARALLVFEDPRRWHQVIFAPFVPIAYYAGHYRGVEDSKPCLAVQVGVGPAVGVGIPGSDFRIVRMHLQQHLEQTRRQFGALELRWAQLAPNHRALQLAVAIANLVGGFIQIHPFVNGNGRISRLLWRWSLLRFGVPPQYCTHPRPDPPYSRLMDAAMRGDYRPLVLYVLSHLSLNKPNQN